MFDLSFGELVVVAVLALLVLGPERLPKAARYAGLWVRKARAQWYSVKSEFERELAADELKRSIGNPVQDLRDDVTGVGRDLGQSVRDLESEARADADAATAVLPHEPASDAGHDTESPGDPGAAHPEGEAPPADDTPSANPEAAHDDVEAPPADKRPEPPTP